MLCILYKKIGKVLRCAGEKG